LGAYSIPSEAGLLVPSGYVNHAHSVCKTPAPFKGGLLPVCPLLAQSRSEIVGSSVSEVRRRTADRQSESNVHSQRSVPPKRVTL
jgi:hypothetical protein